MYLVPGEGISQRATARLASLLEAAHGAPVKVTHEADLPEDLASDALVLAVGKSRVTRVVIADADVAALDAEGYIARSGKLGAATLLAADGRPAKAHPHGNLGAMHGAYAMLEELGYAFLHPLAPTTPPALTPPAAPIDRSSSPRWDERAVHLHTMHPTELTELLQGWGKTGPNDAAGWEAMLPEWERFLEWAVANGQNGVEWFLLWAESWKEFADSGTRLDRLARLVQIVHEYGLDAGLDAPIAFAQQHSYRLLRQQGELPSELSQIRTNLDWIMQAHFDFIGVESGTSEFTHPDPARMLAWMNEVAKHLDEKHAGTRAYIKVHASTGQVADGYADPDAPGQFINYNMLPHHADPRLGVLPHTVQHYGLDDPAPTYGNTDFGYVRDFLRKEIGTRPVVWYPETAYWVSFDVDVPLFLPIYAERRLSDLRLIRSDEDGGRTGRGANAGKGKRMQGQLFFSSGWEWGYWLNDVIAARAAWDPGSPTASPTDAFKTALEPVRRAMGPAGAAVVQWIVDVSEAEQALLIDGKVGGKSPADIVMRNGQAYLQGWETWDDVSKLAQNLPVGAVQMTQPDKLGLVDMRNPLHGGPGYTAEVDPLLAEMETRFADLSARAERLKPQIPAHARDLFDDLADAMRMTALRAAQVHGLYQYVDGYWDTPQAQRLPKLAAARTALDQAATIVREREKRYRVPADRIAGWRENPTAYEYNYLWTVRSLHYWWRDEGKAVDAPIFPCYMNVINPVDVAFGEGIGTDAARLFGDLLSSDQSRGCLAEPTAEPKYPADNLRARP
ncbi:MAG: hypothetical protein KC657_39285 [Myxococcales bacterium]|nr:hypothetical protein [Myxococcales bacterium]